MFVIFPIFFRKYSNSDKCNCEINVFFCGIFNIFVREDFPLVKVRRKMYKPNTTAGKGVKWEWLSATTSEWNLYNMDVQNIVEDAWTKVSFDHIFVVVECLNRLVFR